MTTYEKQADFETGTQAVRDASTARRPDAISLDFLTAWTTGPAAIGDAETEGPESRLWRARVLIQGTIWLARSTLARDSWEPEVAVVKYSGNDPIEELAVGFTMWGDLVIIAQRPTGPGGTPELWIASNNPYL